MTESSLPGFSDFTAWRRCREALSAGGFSLWLLIAGELVTVDLR